MQLLTGMRGRIAAGSPAAVLVLVAVALTALLLAASCAVALKPVPGGEPVSGPRAVTAGQPSIGKPCPSNTVSLANHSLSAVRSIEATLSIGVSVKDPSFSTRLQAGLVADRDSRLRLRAYGGPMCVLDAAVALDSVWVYLPGSAIVVTGTVNEALHAAPDSGVAYVLAGAVLREVLFPSAFTPESCEVSRLTRTTCLIEERVPGRIPGALGEVAPLAGVQPASVPRYYFEAWKRSGSVEVGTGRLRELRLWNARGVEDFSARYDDYRKTAGGVFPHRIAVEFPVLGLSLILSFERVRTNPSIAAETFRVETPDGVNVLRFRELKRPIGRP